MSAVSDSSQEASSAANCVVPSSSSQMSLKTEMPELQAPHTSLFSNSALLESSPSVAEEAPKRSSSRSIKMKKFNDESVESSLIKTKPHNFTFPLLPSTIGPPNVTANPALFASTSQGQTDITPALVVDKKKDILEIVAENEKDRRVCLDISSRETIPSLEIECRLNVPNFCTLPEYDGAVFKSPTFQFADATWLFEFKSDDIWLRKKKCEDDEVVRGLDVYIVRLNSVIQQEIFNKVTLLDANDKEHDIRSTPTVYYSTISPTIKEQNKDLIAIFSHGDPFDRRDTQCLIIQLFCEKSTISDEDKIQNTTNGDLEMKTTKDEKNGNVTLGLSTRKSISSVVCTLKIPNFFILPEYDGTTFESPTLTFAKASFCFRFSSYQRWKSEDDLPYETIYFRAEVVRLDSEIPKQRIFHTIALLDKNDKEYQKESSWSLFDENRTESWMDTFHNRESCWDKRDSLTLIIRLFYDKSTEMTVDHLQNTTQRVGSEGEADT